MERNTPHFSKGQILTTSSRAAGLMADGLQPNTNYLVSRVAYGGSDKPLFYVLQPAGVGRPVHLSAYSLATRLLRVVHG